MTGMPELLDPIGDRGARVGYARVSTRDQNLDRQIAALTDAGCVRIFADKKSGRDIQREDLQAALDYLRPGDTLTVVSLDRLGRSLRDLITIVGDLRKAGIGFASLHENLDTTTPGGRLIFHVFAALAEFIRELIVQGTHEGLAQAAANGRHPGRPAAMTPEQVQLAASLVGKKSVTAIAKLLRVSRTTLYRHVPELKAT